MAMWQRVCVCTRERAQVLVRFSIDTIDGTLVSVENTIITHYSYGHIQFVSFFPISIRSRLLPLPSLLFASQFPVMMRARPKFLFAVAWRRRRHRHRLHALPLII